MRALCSFISKEIIADLTALSLCVWVCGCACVCVCESLVAPVPSQRVSGFQENNGLSSWEERKADDVTAGDALLPFDPCPLQHNL